MPLCDSDMQARPQELDEFAAYYAKYVETVSQKEALEKNHSVVIAMYDMLQECGGKVREEDPPADTGSSALCICLVTELVSTKSVRKWNTY